MSRRAWELVSSGGPFNIVAYAVPVTSPPPTYTSARVGDLTLRLDAVDNTESTRERGYMGWPEPLPLHGQVFVWSAASPDVFWMRDVPYPLDIAFVDIATVVGVETMSPCANVARCPTYGPSGPYTMAIEARAGTFDHVAPGTRVELIVGT